MHNHFSRSRAFTIVELLIVVVVIAILAGVVLVAYSGVRKQAVDSMVANAAQDISQALELAKIKSPSEEYPITSLDIKLPKEIGYALYDTGSRKTFCFVVTHAQDRAIFYAGRNGQEPNKEICDGDILFETDNFNNDVSSETIDNYTTTGSTVGRATAPGSMEFKAETNDTWTELTLSWKKVPEATKYRVNVSKDGGETWGSLRVANVNYSSTSDWDTANSYYSGSLNANTTSFKQTHTIPKFISDTYMFRANYQNSDGSWSDWQQLSISPLKDTAVNMPQLRNMKVVNNSDWTEMHASWDSLGDLVNLPGITIRVNYRKSLDSDWSVATVSSGYSNGQPWDNNNRLYSGQIDGSATTFRFFRPGIVPLASDQIFQYHARLESGSYISDWSVATFDPMKVASFPEISNFRLQQDDEWSQVALNWDLSEPSMKLPRVKLRLNYKPLDSDVWYSASTSSSYGNGQSWDNTSKQYSAELSDDVTAFIMKNYGIMPSTADQVYQYRIRAYSGANHGPWHVITLDPKEVASLPVISNFRHEVDESWSNPVLTWDLSEPNPALPGVKIRFNYRNVAVGTWLAATKTSSYGNGQPWDTASKNHSAVLDGATSSFAIKGSGAKPGAVGQTYQYRVRAYSGEHVGPWHEITVAR